MNNDLKMAVLIVSCDSYSDLWTIFFTLFDKYWPECPYQVYLGTNSKVYDPKHGSVKTICIGDDRSWADNVYKMLSQIKEEYVLMFLEDFFINKPIDTKEIMDRLLYVINNKLDALRLNPYPPPCNVIDKKLDIGEIECGSPYYIATQPAIWKRDSLATLMKPQYSAWDFEIKNSEDANKLGLKIRGSNHSIISHKNGVERGRFYLSTLRFLESEDIVLDSTSVRGVIDDTKIMKRIKLKVYHLKKWVFIKLRLYNLKY